MEAFSAAEGVGGQPIEQTNEPASMINQPVNERPINEPITRDNRL